MCWASAQNLIDRKVKQMDQKVQREEKLEGMYLTYLLSSNKLSLAETSNTMFWTLYHLARDPEVQNRLYQEVVSVCPDRKLLSPEDLSRMPYLKAVIKETLRLYPVVAGNGHLAVENEVVVGGYWFPKQTQFHLCHYAASHDETEFPDAEAFIPERWLRGGPLYSQHHPYSSIPFGVGVRACLGKRVAELRCTLLFLGCCSTMRCVP
ncbi:hypothetical protein HF521_000158 [Silurus meridionalis]|uniref:Uncharacterized protein n=1 Tax=Silurus meridionalis TaxID=175797 RepID=A0A8T0BZN1_SILME|nr:hypothetical protein HF521_000158 [Silurus meridionalis]